MPKSDRRPTRRRATALERPDGRERRLLDRILETPQLARAVPHLQPHVLHKVIETCGLEDCGELVALATPRQLAGVFDLDLWRSARPGFDERLDAARFGLWLDVLLESGVESAAEKIAGVDPDLITAALAQHIRVFDPAAIAPRDLSEGDEPLDTHRPHSGPAADVGGYSVEGTRADAWDSIVSLLLALDAGHPEYFHRLMAGCRRLSNSGFEADGFHDLLSEGEQDLFDLTVDRESRRGSEGFVSPAEAGAFLQMARAYERAPDGTPASNPVAHAYFRDLSWTPPPADEAETIESAPDPDAMAEVADVLRDAGVLAQEPRALLAGAHDREPRLGLIRAQLLSASERRPDAHSRRSEELAYLANTLLVGCSLQGRSFTLREASDAAIAVCNLGLENWPSATSLPVDFLVDRDLIAVFQVGWSVLYRDVVMFAAERLIDVLGSLRIAGREVHLAVQTLRIELTKQWKAGTPWRASDALDTILILDAAAWAALVAVLAEYPVLHSAIASRGPRPTSIRIGDVEFISDNAQIASIHAFIRSLPEVLR